MAPIKNLIVALALATAHCANASPVAVPLRCNPDADDCLAGETCISGDALAGSGSMGNAAFYCEKTSSIPEDVLNSLNTRDLRKKPCNPDLEDECSENEVCVSGDTLTGAGQMGNAAFFCRRKSSVTDRVWDGPTTLPAPVPSTPCDPDGDDCKDDETCVSGDAVAGTGSMGNSAFFCRKIASLTKGDATLKQ